MAYQQAVQNAQNPPPAETTSTAALPSPSPTPKMDAETKLRRDAAFRKAQADAETYNKDVKEFESLAAEYQAKLASYKEGGGEEAEVTRPRANAIKVVRVPEPNRAQKAKWTSAEPEPSDDEDHSDSDEEEEDDDGEVDKNAPWADKPVPKWVPQNYADLLKLQVKQFKKLTDSERDNAKFCDCEDECTFRFLNEKVNALRNMDPHSVYNRYYLCGDLHTMDYTVLDNAKLVDIGCKKCLTTDYNYLTCCQQKVYFTGDALPTPTPTPEIDQFADPGWVHPDLSFEPDDAVVVTGDPVAFQNNAQQEAVRAAASIPADQ
eukprot:GILK01001477.1.p1 GENE.GILK01001477.1~~GILK01001477.1.p1  ORF type:complete len:362 (-),score=72.24 GILK01001477.1:278-1234(-)